MKKYMNAVKRKLNLPKDVKERVMADLETSVQSRVEAGQDPAEIMAELGTPAEVAAELKEQMKDFAYVKSLWRWACLGLAVVSVFTLVFQGAINLLVTVINGASLGVIGGADGPTAIFVTQAPEHGAYSMLMSALIMVMGMIGFYYLGHMRKK